MSAKFVKGKTYAWLAAADHARPAAPNLDPATRGWVSLGEGFFLDEGVTVTVNQEVVKERSLNHLFASAAFRNSADLMVEFALQDLTAESIAVALGQMQTESVPQTDPTNDNVGFKEVKVGAMGIAVAELALLVRCDNSPYFYGSGAGYGDGADAYVSEWYSPRVFESGNFSTQLSARSDPARVPFTFEGLLSETLPADDQMGSWRFTSANTA